MNPEENPKLAANFKNRRNIAKPETALEKYEKAIDEYKVILQDKIHPDNQTAAYQKNVLNVINRLLVAADNLDAEEAGQGIFGLIILALRSDLALKNKILELETKNRDLELRIKKLEKR